LFGSASRVHYTGNALDITSGKGQFCFRYIADTGGLAAKSLDFSCNPDFSIYRRHRVDPGREPDLLGRSDVYAPRPELHGCFGSDA